MLLLSAIALPASGAWNDRVMWIPIAGHSVGAAGREFATTVTVTNNSDHGADVTLAFVPAGKPDPRRRVAQFHLSPRSTHVHHIRDLVTQGETSGAVRLESSEPVVAHARVTSRATTGDPAVGAVLDAIPQNAAIGSGERTILSGPSEGSRYTLHAVETAGHSLILIASTYDGAGRRLRSRRLYLAAHEQRSWAFEGPFASLSIGAMSGSGKAIFAASEIVQGTQDIMAHEMSMTAAPRHRLSRGEIVAYTAAAMAIAVAAIFQRKRAVPS